MTNELQDVAAQFRGVDRTGGILTLEEEHRAAWIAAAARAPVFVLGPQDALIGELEAAATPHTVGSSLADAGDARTIVVGEQAAASAADELLADLVVRANSGTAVVVVSSRVDAPAGSLAERAHAMRGDLEGGLFYQSAANASVITDAPAEGEFSAAVLGSTPLSQTSTFAFAFLGLTPTASTRVDVGIATVEPALIEELLAMNEALRVENRWLAQQRIGVHDAAAARAAKAGLEVAELRRELAEALRLYEDAREHARINFEQFDEARRLLFAANERERKLELQVERHRLNLKLFVSWRLAKVRNRLRRRG